MRFSGGFSYHCPLKINCGARALAGLPGELIGYGARRPLILANPGQVGTNRFQIVVNAFRSSGLTVALYDQLQDPPEPDLLSLLLTLYQDGGCDSLIAVGCGSVVDAAKCLNVLVSTHDRNKKEGVEQHGGNAGALRPLLLVATPGGNGNEATHYARDGNGLLRTARLMPSAVFIDPVMMDGHERAVTNGGLIGLVHAVEAFLDSAAGPLAHAHAHTVVSLMMHYLPRVAESADRRINLSGVVCAQVVAGCAFSASSPGVCHTLAGHLRAYTDIPPGYLMAILLPHMLAETARENAEPVGHLLYPMAGAQDYGLTARDLRAFRVITLLREFYDALNTALPSGMPASLKDAGITLAQLRQTQSGFRSQPDEHIVANILKKAG